MPCTITDRLGYRSAAGTFTALTGQLVYAVPATQTERVSYAGTYRPLIGVNPLITSDAFRYGAMATTDSNGEYSFVLPYGASETKPTTNNAWTIIFPDGSQVYGVVPSVAGPLTIDDLISTYSWVWSSDRYVAPVTPGTLVRGVATFTAATSATITFSASFASTSYVIKLTPSVDSSTGNVPAVGYGSKTTTGFVIHTTGVFTGTCDYEAVL